MENQLVVFDVAQEQYGVEIAAVEGIIKMPPITVLPRAPLFVEGVTTLRGKVLPVIDLRRRFGLPSATLTKDARIVVVEMGGVTVGMVVDGVREVLRINDEAVEPPSPLVTTVASAFIKGLAKVEARLIILLDLGKVLSLDEQTGLHALPTAL